MEYILAIDIGTTNCKAIVFNDKCEAVATRKASYNTINDEPGKSEQNPDEIFEKVVQLIKESVQEYAAIKAVCFSAAMHSFIAVNNNGEPLTNAILWSDTRATQQAETLKDTELGTIIYQKTGTPIHPMSPLCKTMWLRKDKPEIFSAAAKFISIKEYIFYKLFGKYIIDYSIASATGLFDSKNLVWCAEALEVAGISAAALSEPVPVTHQETILQPAFAQIFTTNKALIFIAGGNDGCLANLGCGAINSGDASLTIGTSGAVRMTSQQASADAKQRLFTYLLTDDIFITGGATNNGGIALEWFSEWLTGSAEIEEALLLAATAEAGAKGLLFLPYILGERAPMWDANARGVFFGLHQRHTKAHIARAVVEGICFALNNVIKAAEENNGTIKHLYASGGFIKSGFWLQLLADVSGKKIIINNSSDASATGAALIAMYALGIIKNLQQAVSFFTITQTYEPGIATRNIYDQLFTIFKGLYPKLKDDFAAITKLQEDL